jgi:hypothetical protein
VKIAASIISIAIALGFGVLGVSAVAIGESALIQGFGILVSAYAVAILVLLAKAWRSTSATLPRIAAASGVGLVGLWLGGSFDHGILSGLEVVGVVVVAVAVGMNWWAIRLIARAA